MMGHARTIESHRGAARPSGSHACATLAAWLLVSNPKGVFDSDVVQAFRPANTADLKVRTTLQSKTV